MEGGCSQLPPGVAGNGTHHRPNPEAVASERRPYTSIQVSRTSSFLLRLLSRLFFRPLGRELLSSFVLQWFLLPKADLERYGVAWWRGHHHHHDAAGGIRMEYSGQARRFDRNLTESVDSGKMWPVKAEVSAVSSILGNLKS
jgi:hypothetical protein